MSRFAGSLMLLVALSLGPTSAIAEAATGGAPVATRIVTFTLTSAQCSNLPANTTINGSGTETSVTTTRTDAAGATTIVNATSTQGTATDQAGNLFVFHYTNTFRLSNTVANPDLYSGLMTDTFVLGGNGRVRLDNGFAAELTTDLAFSNVTWKVLSTHGDPISFASGPVVAHCDPL